MSGLRSVPSHGRTREWLIRWGTPSALLLGAFALRIHRLGDANIWWDEGLAVWAVRKTFVGTTLWTAADVHPPLYFWGLWFWVRLVGETEFALRFLSLAYGVLTVAATYQLGRILAGKWLGATAALLLSISRFHIWWSQEMRMYVLATLLCTLSLHLMLSWLERARKGDARRASWTLAGYVAATLAAVGTIYLSAIILILENVFMLAILISERHSKWRSLLGQWVLAQLATIVLFAPWLWLALGSMRTWSVAAPFDIILFLRLYITALSLGISTDISRYTLLVVPIAVICCAGLVLLWRERKREQWLSPRLGELFLVLTIALPAIAVWFLTLPRSIFYTPKVEVRYLLIVAPAFCTLLGWSVIAFWRRWRLAGIAAGLVIVGLFVWSLPAYYSARYLRDDLQTMVRAIASQAEQGDAVLLVSGSRYPIFHYYYGRLPKRTQLPPLYELPSHSDQFQPGNLGEELQPIIANYRRLWLAQVDAQMQDPEALVPAWLGERYQVAQKLSFGHNLLTLFSEDGDPPAASLANLPPQYMVNAQFSAPVTLVGYDLVTKSYRGGDTIRLALYWSASPNYNVSVRSTDRRGRVLHEIHQELPVTTTPGYVRQQIELPVFARTPSGEYTFEAELRTEGGSSLGSVPVGSAEIITPHQPSPSKGSVQCDFALGDGIRLLGYRIQAEGKPDSSTLEPGGSLDLELHWQTDRKQEQRYTVFTHILGTAHNPATGGPVWGQHDSEPLDGGYPTNQWLIGDTIVDRHHIVVDPAAPLGDYQLEIGLYLLESGERLPVYDAHGGTLGDRVLLENITVLEP